jgi:crotonobetaine/carnitine-CoA ligase
MTHAQTYAIAQEIVDGLRVTGQDIFYCFHPMFHMTRFGSVYTALLAGCPVVLDRRFDPAAFLDRARRYGATATIGHGPMLEAIYRQPERPDDADNPLRTILTAPLPARIAADFERRFGVRAIDTWGMTEVTCVTMRPYQAPLRPGSCGRPRDDLLEVRIVDPETDEVLPAGQVGEITVRPREPWVVMQGYLGMPGLTVAAWRNFRFHSGDFGYLTEDGYLYFAERSADRIRRRAENVSAYDIESAAVSHPRVQDCAAVGVASQFESDDDIKLCVVPAAGPPPDEADLIRHLVQALPHYMVPRYIEVLPELPRTPTGKIQRQVLRASGTGPGVWDRAAAGLSVRALSGQGPPGGRLPTGGPSPEGQSSEGQSSAGQSSEGER